MNPNLISSLLPILLISQLMGGNKKQATLKHSPGRNTAKIVMGSLGILGGLGATVAAPIVLAVVRPAIPADDPSLTTVALLGANVAQTERANFAAQLTGYISAGVGLVAEGVGVVLSQA